MNPKPIQRYLLVIPLISLLFTGCGSRRADQEAVSDTDGRRVEPVRVIEIAYSDIARGVTYTANLHAYREVHLAPAAPGRINRIYVEPGQKVSEGQQLVEMDRTQLQQALLQLQNIETDYRRLDTLRRVGSISQQQYDQIRTQYELARSNVAFLQENTKMVSPFSGTVSGKYFENGEMFSGAPNTQAGKAAVLSLVQTSRLKAIVNVAERFLPYVQTGMAVKITTDTYPTHEFSGTVSIIFPVIDAATRTFRVELAIPNPQELLKPGMFARAHFELDQVQAFVVPSLAVLKLQGSNERYVFLEKNGQAKRVVVEIGDRYDDMVELISDEISKGDRLIIAGQARLLDGVGVEVVQ